MANLVSRNPWFMFTWYIFIFYSFDMSKFPPLKKNLKTGFYFLFPHPSKLFNKQNKIYK